MLFFHWRSSLTSAAKAALPLLSVGLSCLSLSPSALGQTGEQTAPNTTVIPIGQVQGAVPDDVKGTSHKSPFAGARSERQSVTVQGVVTAKMRSIDERAQPQFTFFLQNTTATADADPNTSDGIYVFMGRFVSLRGGYEPAVGDEIVLSAQVVEYFTQTQLSRPQLVRRVRGGVNLDAEVPAFEAMPPDSLDDANRYWERREGMRARVPQGSVVVSGRHTFSNDAEVWVMRPDHPLAKRTDAYARRAFRDAHPLDNAPGTFDDGNGYRICLGSQALRGVAGNDTASVAPARTFDTLAETATGPVAYTFGKYAIQVERPVTFARGADPSRNAPPTAPNRAREYSVATYNVENLYDFRDDPNDGCDFRGNSGCPGVSPPFDYVPASEAEYRTHLGKLAASIVTDLHAPDVLLIVEAEDQDICKVENGALACGTTDNADGRPDSLQELALTIAAQAGGIRYEAAYDRDGADNRGITTAFLYRVDRVTMPPADTNDALLGSTASITGFEGLPFNTQVSNPKALNAPIGEVDDRDTEASVKAVFTRAPQVGRFRIYGERAGQGEAVELYLINNHFSSRPNQRVTQRRAQAQYLAALVTTLQKSQPGARVIAGGDLNVYPRPDDPFTPAERKKPSDQLAPLYETNMTNLWDVLVQEAPANAYTYVFNGMAQTLDHLWNTPAQRAHLGEIRVAHVNSDWPDETTEFGNRRASDHDPVVAKYTFAPNATAPSVPTVSGGTTSAGNQAPATAGTPRTSSTAGTAPAAATPVTTLINLNTATAKELDKLPGVGPALAARIIAYREANGGFKTIEELSQVKGIGKATLEKLRPLVSLQ